MSTFLAGTWLSLNSLKKTKIKSIFKHWAEDPADTDADNLETYEIAQPLRESLPTKIGKMCKQT